jgi:NAD(P)H-dependent FMN reductase
MSRIGIILGSTRPNRNGEQVVRWVYEIASRRGDAQFELVDLRDYTLAALETLLDQVIAWSTALAPLRQPAPVTAY